MAITKVRDIRNAMLVEIAAELGATYSELAYVEDVQKNSLRTSNQRYGVRQVDAFQIDGVNKFATFDQTFQVVLTKGYTQSNIDDSEQRETSLDLTELAHDIYVRMFKTKAGLPSDVINVKDLSISEPEYLEDDKVTIIRANLIITYRNTLL